MTPDDNYLQILRNRKEMSMLQAQVYKLEDRIKELESKLEAIYNQPCRKKTTILGPNRG